MYYEITNCGAGNAIEVDLHLGNRIVLKNFYVTTASSQKIIFILNEDLLDENGECKLEFLFNYTDISFVGIYRQSESMMFSRNYKNQLQTVQLRDDILTKPVEISK